MAPFRAMVVVRSRARVWLNLVHLVSGASHIPAPIIPSYCSPESPCPRPLSLPLRNFSLEMDRWCRAVAPAAVLPSWGGSTCLQRVHRTASGNSGVAGWSRSVGCGSVPSRLDSDVLVVVARSPQVRVGRCRPLGRGVSAHNAGATRDLALTMMRAWVVIFLKCVRRATAWRCLPLAAPTGPGQIDRVSPPVPLEEEGSATARTVAWLTARLVRRQSALFGM